MIACLCKPNLSFTIVGSGLVRLVESLPGVVLVARHEAAGPNDGGECQDWFSGYVCVAPGQRRLASTAYRAALRKSRDARVFACASLHGWIFHAMGDGRCAMLC